MYNSVCIFKLKQLSCRLGVADGVGQWRSAGYDPSIFSTTLMENCRQLMIAGEYSDPMILLQDSYNKLLHEKQIEGGLYSIIFHISTLIIVFEAF